MREKNSFIPWSVPDVGRDELEEIKKAFSADWLTMGPKVNDLERRMADRLQVEHAIAVSNGSIAIDIVLKIHGVGYGDEVIVPSLTYFATAAAVSRVGAIPVFVDVTEDTINLNPDLIEAAITDKTKAVIYIDYGGIPALSDEIHAVCEKHGLTCIQDAAQSLGGTYKGKALGSQAKTSTMSFHMAKVMSTVEGGMIFTHDEKVAEEARIYRNQGESAKYMHSRLGFNARMNDITAAIGLVQESKLNGYLAERARVFELYVRLLDGLSSVKIVKNNQNDCSQANFLFTVLVDNRDDVVIKLREKGVDTRVCYPLPLYKQELYVESVPCRYMDSPVSEMISKKVLNLPIYPTLSNENVSEIVEIVKTVI